MFTYVRVNATNDYSGESSTMNEHSGERPCTLRIKLRKTRKIKKRMSFFKLLGRKP